MKVTFALPEPPAVRVIEGWRKVVATVPVPVKLLDRVTVPAKPLVAAGLPRLAEDIFTAADPPAVKLTPVTLLVRVNPLTLIESTPEALVTSGGATWLILICATPSLAAAVTLTALVMVAPPGRVKAAGRR